MKRSSKGDGCEVAFGLEVKNLKDGSKFVRHAQQMLLCPTRRRGEQASFELMRHAKHYDTQYYPDESICGARKGGDRFEVLVRWLGFEDGNNGTWEAFGELKEDLPEVMGDFSYSAVDRNIKQNIFGLYY